MRRGPVFQNRAEWLFQVLVERHEGKSVSVITTLGFAYGTRIFGETNLIAAFLKHMTHRPRFSRVHGNVIDVMSVLKTA
jgi:hypothetical protein